MRLYSRVSTLLFIKNETMAPLHVATLTIEREFDVSRYLFTKNETMAPLHVATHTYS